MAKALEGVRILDFSMFLAGPHATKLLGDMGAEVIKIEAPHHPDALRMNPRDIYPDGDPGERPWNRSGMINERNRSKLGITLDLAADEGRNIFLDLVSVSDVVLENFRVGVMDRLGVGLDTLKQVNPTIILASLSSQGTTGPEKGYRSFGNTLEKLSGLFSLTGYPDEPPYFNGMAFPDPLTGYMGVGLVAAALRHRRLTGEGVHVDISQRELATAVVGEAIMDFTMNGRIRQPLVNGHTTMAPHAVYPCEGEDNWVAIAVEDDDQWQSLCAVMGQSGLADDARFRDGLSRWRNQEELNAIISDWSKDFDHYELMNRLQAHGVAAGVVMNSAGLMSDPHLDSREFFELSDDPEAGPNRYYGRPWKLSKTPGTTLYPAPLFAQHNALIYGELLGIGADEIADLDGRAITSDIPSNPRDRLDAAWSTRIVGAEPEGNSQSEAR